MYMGICTVFHNPVKEERIAVLELGNGRKSRGQKKSLKKGIMRKKTEGKEVLGKGAVKYVT